MLAPLQSPPILEVGAALEWPGIADFDAMAIAAWWSERKIQFPKYRLQRAAAPGGLSVDFGDGAPPLRGWFFSQDDAWVVQVDAKRLAVHWRRTRLDSPYPRFQSRTGGVLDRMVEEWMAFQGFLTNSGLAQPAALRVTVLKVDALRKGLHWTDADDAAEMLPVIAALPMWKHGDGVRGVQVNELRENADRAVRWSVASRRDQHGSEVEEQLRLETSCTQGSPATDVRSTLIACNAEVNALFANLIPAQQRTQRFSEEPHA